MIAGILVFLTLCIIAFIIVLNQGIISFVHLNKVPRKNKIHVACVGDSITYGYGVNRWTRNNYPHKLGILLISE